MWRVTFAWAALALVVAPMKPAVWSDAAPAAGRDDERRVVPNDNRTPAGSLRAGVLTLRLEARRAMWHPDGDTAPGAAIPAFAEEGKAPRIPGPLVRVPRGTVVALTVHNALRDTLRLFGLHARAVGDSVATPPPMVLAPGERRTLRYRLDASGTFMYWGTTMNRRLNFRSGEDSQLTGAIVVDDTIGRRAHDRIFVLGMWSDTVHRAMMRRSRILGVINGRSWPNTERLDHVMGDTVRWHVINGSADLHPMHLHGFFFRIDGRGSGSSFERSPEGTGPLAVTQGLGAGETIAMSWIPERSGNWLFHCHVPEHFGARGSLGTARPASAMAATTHGDHATGGMNGMVMGIVVRPRARGRGEVARATPEGGARELRLLVRANVGSSRDAPFFGYAVHERGSEPPPPDTGLRGAPVLDLERGRPVRITVVNHLAEATAVHWHGIELESYFDGVPGFSGMGRSVTPLIAPGDSFEVRFTPPREGSYIYHTHADEERQQLAGLAGAIIVSPPGVRRDPAVDIPLVLTAPTAFDDQGRIALVNGSATPAPLTMRAGTTYRLRLIQMSVHRAALRVDVTRDSTLATWRPVGKDGAALPDRSRTPTRATTFIGVGETYDYELTPDRPGTMRLEVRLGAPWPASSRLMTTLPITVTPRE